MLKGRHVAQGIRCIIIPATQAIYLQAMEEGLLKIFIEAGAIVSTPTCGPCLGGYMGVLAAGEGMYTTTNRNFVGRWDMWIPRSIWRGWPWPASAVTGRFPARNSCERRSGLQNENAEERAEGEVFYD